MKFKIVSIVAATGVAFAMAACAPVRGSAYWQRVEDSSALYMTGSKAQQHLEENIAACVREVDEMVELEALRKAPATELHNDYRRALKQSGDLAYYDKPTHLGDKKIAHTDFHDFEGCMRFKGWERVRYVRYQTRAKAHETYRETKQYRDTGVKDDDAVATSQQTVKNDFSKTNK